MGVHLDDTACDPVGSYGWLVALPSREKKNLGGILL